MNDAHRSTIKMGLLIIGCSAWLGACQTAAVTPQHGRLGMNGGFGYIEAPEYKSGEPLEPAQALDLSAIQSLDKIMPKLLEKRVIFVGETHDRYDHHLNQLDIIRRTYENSNELAIGMEFFQLPFQPVLDAYIAGKIDEKEFLRKSEYFQRWRVDYRNYRPIIRYAKEKGIPLLALDLSEELRRKIVRNEMNNLSAGEIAQIPKEIDRSNQDYREMLQDIFAMHPDSADFERFMEVQLSRDEAMAQTAATYLQQHPKARMVILAGGGHLVYRFGIPSRLTRRIDAPSVVVLNDSIKQYDNQVADYMLLPAPLRLPKEVRMGVVLDTTKAGQLSINGFAEDSPALAAGLKKGDRLLSLDSQPLTQMADLKIALLDKNAGDKVQVKVQRAGWFGTEKELGFEVPLY